GLLPSGRGREARGGAHGVHATPSGRTPEPAGQLRDRGRGRCLRALAAAARRPGGGDGVRGHRGGVLTLVATPIGNLGDLSPRAVEALAEADVVACEDTRRTRKLLSHAGVRSGRLVSVNDHSEAARVRQVLAWLDEGQQVAVVSDAGLPGISDPGERLVA